MSAGEVEPRRVVLLCLECDCPREVKVGTIERVDVCPFCGCGFVKVPVDGGPPDVVH